MRETNNCRSEWETSKAEITSKARITTTTTTFTKPNCNKIPEDCSSTTANSDNRAGELPKHLEKNKEELKTQLRMSDTCRRQERRVLKKKLWSSLSLSHTQAALTLLQIRKKEKGMKQNTASNVDASRQERKKAKPSQEALSK
jgi:hypothetical protein